jgi:cytochrome b
MTDLIASSSSRAQTVPVWDWPTRAFHWGLVTLIACAWISAEFAGKIGDPLLRWHRWNGYAILVLLVFRLLWGFFGSSTARFSSFVTWPWRALGYGFDLLRGLSRPYLGHNPLGTWMILALAGLVGLQAVLGLYTLDHNEIVSGPLLRTITDDLGKTIGKWHVFLFDIMLILVGVHILANSLYGLVKKDPLIRAMVTGRKPAKTYEDAPAAVLLPNPGKRAGLCLLAAIIIVFGSITLLGGRIL